MKTIHKPRMGCGIGMAIVGAVIRYMPDTEIALAQVALGDIATVIYGVLLTVVGVMLVVLSVPDPDG